MTLTLPRSRALPVLDGNTKITDFGTISQFIQRIPQRSRQNDGSGPAAFPENSDLPGVAAGAEMPPMQRGSLGNAQATGLQELEQDLVA